MQCQACGADLPDDARFCIECGAEVSGVANTGATVQLPRPGGEGVICRSCGATNPDYAVYCVRCGQPVADSAPQPAAGPRTAQSLPRSATAPQPVSQRLSWEGVAGAIFLLGLAALFLFKLPFWPGILIVIGVSSFAGEALRGRWYSGLSSALWLFGIACLFLVPRLWLPGLLVLVGLSILLEMARRSLRLP